MWKPKVLNSALILFLLLAGGISQLQAGYQEAVTLYNQGKYEKAIQELQTDLDNNPNWEFGERLLGLCLLNLNKNALAISHLSRAVELKSTTFSTYLGLAQAYFNMQNYGECIAALDKGEPIAAKESNPEANQAKLYRLRGTANYRLNKFNEAVNDLTNALRLSPATWADFSMLGVSYFKLNRTDEAIEALEKSYSMKSDQPAVLELLGTAYLTKGTEALSNKQFALAAQQLTKAKNYNPKNGYIYYNLAETYLFEKKYSDAENALSQAVRLLPKNPEVYERLGLVYEKLKKWDLALSAYEKALGISPSKALKDAIARVKNNKSQ
jgi:tetratricopeptide (TPR) repeat protein